MDTPASSVAAAGLSISSAHCDAVLARHRCQEKSSDCGPFCATMVINALTPDKLDPIALAREMDHPRWRAIAGIFPLVRRVPGSATFPWGMVDVLRQHGLNARWRALATVDQLRAGLDRGHVFIPIVGLLRPRPWAHYMVLLAHDPARGWGFADPESRSNHISWRTPEKFERQWGTYGRLIIEVAPVGGA